MASPTDNINITNPKINKLTEVKKLKEYKEFTEIVEEYNQNKNKLDKDLQSVKKVDPKNIKDDRNKYFLALIKKQAGLKDIPVDAGTSTFNLLYKRALKLNAIISVYAKGKKTKEYEDFVIFSAKEKWKNKLMDKTIDAKDNKTLLPKCKYWLDYLKKLIRFLENEKNESKVEELFSNMIKSENNTDNTRSQAHIISELKKILGTNLSSTKIMGKVINVVASDVSLMSDEEYGAQYGLLKDFFTRIRKICDVKFNSNQLNNDDVDVTFAKYCYEGGVLNLISNRAKIVGKLKKCVTKGKLANKLRAKQEAWEAALLSYSSAQRVSKSSGSKSSKKKHKHKHRSREKL